MSVPSAQPEMSPRRRPARLLSQLACVRPGLFALLLLPLLTGCLNTVPTAKYNTVTKDLLDCQEARKKVENDLNEVQLSVKNLQSQIAELRNTKGGSFDDLVVPIKIDLERMSGGVDTDGKPGDDAIWLYVQPVDKDGAIIKAAGSIKVTLFDLQNTAARNTIAEYNFDVQHTRGLWFGRLMTNHFTVKCPFPHPLAHDRITADVVFTDLLTGRPLHAQQVFTIKLAAVASSSPH